MMTIVDQAKNRVVHWGYIALKKLSFLQGQIS